MNADRLIKKLVKDPVDDGSLSKEQDAVARYVRFNCPTSTTMFQGNEVHYFSGSKAIDTLMESKYGSKAKNEAAMLFPNRQAAVNYMRELMDHQLFFHARKLVPKKKEDKEKKDKDSGKLAKLDKDEKKKKDDETVTETEAEDKKDEKKAKDSDEKKTKVFNDDKDVYVWVFDPTPLYKKVIGLFLGTIVGCLFPLWPIWLRQGVYYLSLAGISLFGAIVVVAILRTILFGIIWLGSMGQHKLWILPNLTEDCGFFESFQPWYTYEYCPRNEKKNKDGKKAKQKKAKDSGKHIRGSAGILWLYNAVLLYI
ncbi:unnamed protein product [Haemonchus placei]|uniref:Translocation protein SEC62 n=1 Tax=Haemonchus placei TaxID=6290 RepID=A0A0N4WT23_HAEPC|nr:unnamed protein product [Haemonchus placei]